MIRTTTMLCAALALGCGGGGGSQGGDGIEGGDGTSGGEAITYEIRIHRGLSPGMRVHVDVQVERSLTAATAATDTDGAAESEAVIEDLRVRVAGVVDVGEVDEEGRALSAQLTVEAFEDPESGEAIVPSGAIITAERGDEGFVFALEGGELDEDQQALLAIAFPLQRPGSPLGDELMGTTQMQPVGAHWDLNREFFSEQLGEYGLEVTELQVQGDAVLREVIPCGDGDCLVVEAVLDIDQATLDATSVENVSVEEGTVSGTIGMLIPADGLALASEETTDLTGRFTGSFRQDGATVDRDILFVNKRTARYDVLE